MKQWVVTAAVTLVAAGAFAAAADVTPTAITVRDAWARATPPGAGVAAAYLTIVGGSTADRLVAASTEVAAMTRLHTVTESDGMARMRESAGIDIPAGTTVVLAPTGTHLMLMNLERPLLAGQHFVVTLTFARAGGRDVRVAVVAPGQAFPAHP